MTETKSIAVVPAIDFGSMLKGVPPGSWVAVSRDKHELLGYAAEMRDALSKAQAKGVSTPIVFRVPQKHVAMVL